MPESRFVRTTVADETTFRPADLVDVTSGRLRRIGCGSRPDLREDAPLLGVRRLHRGLVPRRVVGKKASCSLRAHLAIDPLDMAGRNRERADELSNLAHEFDRGVQHLSVRYSASLEENDIVASFSSHGDSCDNALYELIRRHGPWQSLTNNAFATPEYVDWFNDWRRHGQIRDGPCYTSPVERENATTVPPRHRPATALAPSDHEARVGLCRLTLYHKLRVDLLPRTCRCRPNPSYREELHSRGNITPWPNVGKILEHQGVVVVAGTKPGVLNEIIISAKYRRRKVLAQRNWTEWVSEACTEKTWFSNSCPRLLKI